MSADVVTTEEDPMSDSTLSTGTGHSYWFATEDLTTVRDHVLEAEYTRDEREGYKSLNGATCQPMFSFKDGDVGCVDVAENEYWEHGRRVSDFHVRTPAKMAVDHVAELCICLHSKLQHSAAVDHDVCAACKCERFNPVAPKASRHAFKRGQRVKAARLADVLPGQRVLCGWSASHGKVRLTDVRSGAMVAEVTRRKYALPKAEASGQSWFDRALIITTDLGESVPQSGGTRVLILT